MQSDHTAGGRSAALHNLGCKVNAYETEAMQQQLAEAGYRIVPFAPGADVYVINTCSVTNIADRKSRQMLHRARKMNPEAVVVAAGCYVQTAREKTGLAVEADILLGSNRKGELVRALEQFFDDRDRTVEKLTDISRDREYESLFISRTQEHTRAFIKVQDGCDQFCSYCIIPYARGRVRSRTKEDVVREVSALCESGIREIVLTGIHLSSYGKDLDRGEDLLGLIRAVSLIPGTERIRLGSLEPGIVTETFAGELAQIPQICPHFHLSLQSGSDSVLARMNRRYDTQDFLERCRILRTYFERPALTTDIIVGFPQESEEEFEETVAFLQRISFYETHIFKYSRREGTKAAAMKGQVPEQVKTARSSRLIDLGEKNKQAYLQQWDGKRAEVLFEEEQEIAGRRLFTGYTREYVRVCRDADRDYTNRVLPCLLHLDPATGLMFAVNRTIGYDDRTDVSDA